MLQVDGSRHDWLQGRGPYLSLVGAIDDATGTVPYALFRQQEDAQGYLLLLREIIHGKGMPLALYSDRHSIFQVNPQQGESLEDQLAGGRKPTTQVGRALQELGVQLIVALSPQAKGRIERLWGTFQDRLVSELRLAGATTVEEANQVLWAFLPRFQRPLRRATSPARFSLSARGTRSVLEGVLCFSPNPPNGRREDRGRGKGVTGAMIRARVRVDGRLAGGLQALFGGTDVGLQWLWRARWQDRLRQEALADRDGVSLGGRWVG